MLNTMIVDGTAVSRDVLHSILANGGYNIVAQTNNSVQALALARKFRPQIACIDMELLNDGTRLLDVLHEQLPKTLIFMMTSELDAQTLQQSMARGVHGVMVKPFNASKVLGTIRNAVLALVKRQQALTT